MKINKKQFIILTFLIFWGIIALSITTGVWKSKMKGIEIQSKEITGKKIKGWMKFMALEKLFKVPLKHIYNELKLPKNIDPTQSIKTIKEKYNFEMEELRKIVVQYHENK